MRSALLTSTAAILTVCLAYPAAAQDQTNPASPAPASSQTADDGSQISDIVVTAQRREERIQTVPIAISAFTGAQLEAQGVSNTLQLGQYVPNLVSLNNTGLGSANSYFLRGLGNTETIATFDPPIGTYVDDVYISRQNANNLSLFDVERVEVLRGPQGTLFGRNTTGGAINVILRKPGNEFGGYAEIGYGSYHKKLARASIDAPLADSFAIKVSGYWQDDRGYTKNVTTGQRINDDDGWGVRLGLRGELAPWARWNASYAHIVADGENLLNFDCNPADPTQCDGRFVTTGLLEGKSITPSPYAPLVITGRKANYGLGNRTASDLITSNLAFDVADKTTLSLITGFVRLRQQFALDFFDGRGGPNLQSAVPPVRGFPRGGFTIINDGYHEEVTQEIKLNGLIGDGLINYVGGFYYFHEYNRTDFADVFSIFTGAPGGLGLLLGDRTLRNKTEAYAGYGQADLNLGQFTLTAGIRYTDETKNFRMSDNRASCNDGTLEPACLDNANLVAPSGARIPTKQSTKLWTPRFAANFKPSDDIMFFASATRGFKSGGWNARGTAPGQLLPFGPEKAWSYEGGVKSEFFNHTLRANLTVFYLDVSGLQTPSALVAPNGAITFITRNFANYRNKGAELELLWVPVQGLTLFANGGYQDDKYRLPKNAPAVDIYGIQSVAAQQVACRAQLAAGQIPGAANTAPTGQPANNAPACAAGIVAPDGSIATPVRTPKWTISLGGSYKAELGGGLSLTPSVNASFRSRQEVGTSELSFYNAPITGTNGTFPSNPFGNGAFITGSESKANWLVNAGIALNGPDDRWTLALDCQNCLDQEYVQSTLANYTYINRPREWMVRGKYRF
jgi:iron complex outermembrane receptor protein